MYDLAPAAQEMSRLVSAVGDDQLSRPTPCSDWTVADLLAHIHQFATVFTDNARKQPTRPPQRLVDDWRAAIPRQLGELADAWAVESAWEGKTSAGGIEMDAADNALVAVEELTVHGWDLASATGQPIEVRDDTLDRVDRFFERFAGPIESGQGPFGPVAEAPADADRLARTVARTGRDPRWSPSQ